MSTTAGVGTGMTYRQVSPLAVAAVVAAVLSLSVFIHPAMTIIPIAGVVLSILALVAVTRSNGTQVGRTLAIGSLIASSVLAGLFAWRFFSTATSERTMATDVRQTVASFGDALAAEDYASAYALMAGAFQEDVAESQFGSWLSGYPAAKDREGEPVFGNITGAKAGERIKFSEAAGDRTLADTELIVTFEHGEPLTQSVLLNGRDGTWKLRQFEQWFAE